MLEKPIHFLITLSCISLISFGLLTGCHSIDNAKSPRPDTAAYEAVHFGMTEKDYRNSIKDTLTVIDNGIFKLNPFFIPGDHRLYMLQLRSNEQPPENFDSQLQDDMKSLINKFTGLYGNPTRWDSEPIKDRLEPHKVIWRCEWNYSNKYIKIGIGRLPDKTNRFAYEKVYIAVCEITNKQLHGIANTQIVYTQIPF